MCLKKFAKKNFTYISPKKFHKGLYLIYNNTEDKKIYKKCFYIFSTCSISYGTLNLYYPNFLNKFLFITFLGFSFMYGKNLKNSPVKIYLKNCGKKIQMEKMSFFNRKNYFEDLEIKDIKFKSENKTSVWFFFGKTKNKFLKSSILNLDVMKKLGNDCSDVEYNDKEFLKKKAKKFKSKIF